MSRSVRLAEERRENSVGRIEAGDGGRVLGVLTSVGQQGGSGEVKSGLFRLSSSDDGINEWSIYDQQRCCRRFKIQRTTR